MDFTKIKRIEENLNRLEDCSVDELKVLTDELLASICETLNISQSSNLISALFNERTSTNQKKLIAVSMLRALCRNQSVVWNHNSVTLRNKTFDLFDEILVDIYKQFQIDIKSDKEEKTSKLQEIEGNLNRKFFNLEQSICDLKDLDKFKSDGR